MDGEQYVDLVVELKQKNKSRYEELAKLLNAGGVELMKFEGSIYKFSVDLNGCAFSCSYDNGVTYSRISWVKLTKDYAERLVSIKDALAECEATALLKD